MTRATRPAFTIIELLVVIAIIVLLMGLVLPSLQSSRRVARTAKCAHNLHQIQLARTTLRADAPGSGVGFSSITWVGDLLPYFGGDGRAFTCPEDDTAGTPDTGILLLAVRFDQQITSGKLPFTIPATEGPYVKKTDVNATGYTLIFDDLVVQDWNDIVLRFDISGASTTITYVSDNSRPETHVDLMTANGQILLGDMGASGNATTKPGAKVTTTAGANSSYGMNRSYDGPAPGLGGGRVLFLDYGKSVADPADDWSTYLQNGRYTFARHAGKCNVSMVDGSLRQVAPSGIDPALTALRQRYWLP